MVKIKYIGDISPCRVKVYDAIYDNWKREEIKDLTEEYARKLTQNKNFKRVRETITKPLKDTKIEEEREEGRDKMRKEFKIEKNERVIYNA